jgi:drug/metabolite transporter (DMT)-like permease
MVLAMACFIANDAIVKRVSESVPPAQLIFVRGAMASALVLAIALAMRVPMLPAALREPRVLLRAAIDAGGTFGYLIALFHLPIANATAINMAAPLFVVALAAVLLGERVDGRRWLAVFAGFGGVLLVIRPDVDGFNGHAWLCLLATLLHAGRDLATRRIPARFGSLAITLASLLTVTMVAGAAVVVLGWRALGAESLALLAAAATLMASGLMMITMSARVGQMSAIAPWRYTGLLWALVLGWLLWGEVPDALAWAGIGLLLAAGLFLMRREAVPR